MSERDGSLLEISRSEDAVDYEWRIPGAETKKLERGIKLLWSPDLSIEGMQLKLVLGIKDPSRGSSPLILSLCRHRPLSPGPVVRYWLGVVKVDGGREVEEIGRGRREPASSSVDHPWLSFPELRRRFGSSDTLSIIVRLRTGPETDNEMKSLASREVYAEKFTQTDIEDLTAGGASSSVERRRETTRVDSEDVLILQGHLKKLLLHANDHDVTITVKEKKFKAHKSVLRARSPVFEAMFTHPMTENEEDTVTIDDVDPECFGAFLAYVYTGEVEDLSPSNVMGLFYAADKYDFPALKRSCVKVLKASLSTTLVCDVIALAATHGEEELLESAMAYVTEHLVQIMETVEWQRFVLRNPIQANEVSLKAIKRRLNSNPP